MPKHILLHKTWLMPNNAQFPFIYPESTWKCVRVDLPCRLPSAKESDGETAMRKNVFQI